MMDLHMDRGCRVHKGQYEVWVYPKACSGDVYIMEPRDDQSN